MATVGQTERNRQTVAQGQEGKKVGQTDDILRSGKDLMEGVDIFQIECLAVQMEHRFSFQFCKLPVSAIFFETPNGKNENS